MLILIVVVLLVVFGGGGSYYYGSSAGWGPSHYGGIGIVGLLLIVFVVWLLLGRGGL